MITNQLNRVYGTYNRVDPTRTLTLRNAFARDMRKRFKELTNAIKVAIVDEDVFGLGTANAPHTVLIQQVSTPGAGAFAFPRDPDKVIAFMRWLEIQIENAILKK